MGKMDKIGIKKRKIWEVLVEKSKKFWEKSPNLINTRDLIITQGGFFSKNNKRTVSNKHEQAGFWTQKQ